MKDVLTLILGGGRGTRLFPLTHTRSKPAVPIGGKYRLIDVPISNCLHADLRQIFVLTQFNSASLNRHVAQTYRLDTFRKGFVEILAAEQTPDSTDWFQGTADAVRQARRHFVGYPADYFLILAGDHLYRMDLLALVNAHAESGADITVAAQPASKEEATGLGIFLFDSTGHIAGFEEKPSAARLDEIGSSASAGPFTGWGREEKPFVGSMGIYVFSRDVLLDVLDQPGVDFGREIIPAALRRRMVRAFPYDGYWADVGTVESFYNANLLLTRPDAPFRFYHPDRPIYTHPRYLPGSRLDEVATRDSVVTEGCLLSHCAIDRSVVGIRTRIDRGARISRSVLLGADFYDAESEEPARKGTPLLGIGRDAVLDRVIVDKNARIGDGVRLVNERNLDHLDGDGYYIRNGIIIVPKNGVVKEGTLI
jgi:glucose-1-phosphate adenylyltransferase